MYVTMSSGKSNQQTTVYISCMLYYGCHGYDIQRGYQGWPSALLITKLPFGWYPVKLLLNTIIRNN